MKLRPNDTIKSVCPVFNQLETDEQLSIWYAYIVLLNDDNYELTELIFELIIITVFVNFGLANKDALKFYEKEAKE